MGRGVLTSPWVSLREVERCPANQIQAHQPGDTESGVELRLREMLQRLNDNLVGGRTGADDNYERGDLASRAWRLTQTLTSPADQVLVRRRCLWLSPSYTR